MNIKMSYEDMGFVRDKRSPASKNEHVSRLMSANKARNTVPEIRIRQALWNKDIRGYRLNYKGVPGRPDIAFVSKKIAVFVNGCFWHRCPYCKLPLPKTNQPFWENKFLKNKERDARKRDELKKMKWKVITLWECKILNHLDSQINKIYKQYNG